MEAARTGDSYVLSTGTGSGKSLAYIIPIVDKVLTAKANKTYEPGIKAIVVYPMNALANSQLGELEKFLGTEGANRQVTFERYTGQESTEKRDRIIANPPDILLTNYVMLDLILTRPRERRLVAKAKGLWFLVLDELHTYRGRQSADVTLLVRRLRDACDAPSVQCIGASATMTTEGGPEEQKKQVASVATTLFGVPVDPGNVIGETLRRITDPSIITPDKLRERVTSPQPPADFQELVNDPLATWIEGVFGFEPDSPPDNPRRRRCPPTIPEAARQLASEAGIDETSSALAIKDTPRHKFRRRGTHPSSLEANDPSVPRCNGGREPPGAAGHRPRAVPPPREGHPGPRHPYFANFSWSHFRAIPFCLTEYGGVEWLEVVHPARTRPLGCLRILPLVKAKLEKARWD